MDRCEEALERAKKGLPIDEVFPELKESEDERIRKELIGYLTHRAEVTGFIDEDKDCKRWIAYLEKQKEQKPVQSEVEREYVRTLKSLISDFLRGKEEVDREYYQQIFDWLDGRHIERKSAEKQDYSGLNDLERAIHRGFLSAGVENVPITIIKETANECKRTQTIANENANAEWAELQSEFKNINEAFEDGKKEVVAHPERYGLCKPAEWSEEDEKKRRNLMSLLVNMRGDRITEETYQKYYPWLKSLRSRPKISDNWKPSEEQIRTLDIVISDYRHACTKDSDKKAETLKPLLEQLEKL